VLTTIAVADTGVGVAAKDLSRLFQPFEQLREGTRAGGTGLGLAISLAYARLMRGDLAVESVVGGGTTFTFTFVAKLAVAVVTTEEAEETGAVSSLVAAAARRRKVLIVDDARLNRDLLAELLARPGFETRTATDGRDALSMHADWSPDLVLIDVRMPEMDGLEAIRRMRAAGSRAVIGAVTASILDDDERQALAEGADFFVRKPYNDRELLGTIARVLTSGAPGR
jgi:CheY-like chemotaxis protein